MYESAVDGGFSGLSSPQRGCGGGRAMDAGRRQRRLGLAKEVQLAQPKAQPGCTDEGASPALTAQHPKNRSSTHQRASTREEEV